MLLQELFKKSLDNPKVLRRVASGISVAVEPSFDPQIPNKEMLDLVRKYNELASDANVDSGRSLIVEET